MPSPMKISYQLIKPPMRLKEHIFYRKCIRNFLRSMDSCISQPSQSNFLRRRRGCQSKELFSAHGPHSTMSLLQIYFASRTHSQLSQVIQELVKLKFANQSIMNSEPRTKPGDVSVTHKRLPKTVTLASRDRLCINDDLRRKATDLDEGCRDLMKS